MDAARLLAALFKPAIAAVAVAAVSAGLVVGVRSLQGGSDRPAPLVRSTGAAPQVVFSSFGDEADTVFAAPADDPADRTQVASLPHVAGFGASAALSPDGRRIAYTALPPDTARPSAATPAEVRVVEAGSDPRLLAGDADLLIAPVWAPDGRSLVVRRSQAAEDQAGTFRLSRVTLDGDETLLVEDTGGLFPVAFTPDGVSFYYVRLSSTGSDLMSVPARGGGSSLVAHLGDDFTRDWRLSPDGTRLSYLTEVLQDGRFATAVRVVDLSGGGLGGLDALNQPKEAGDEFGPVWWPDGSKVVLGRTEGSSAAPARAVSSDDGSEQAVGTLDQGFDVPLAVAPGGSYLAVRSFKSGTPQEPGPSAVQVVGPDGRIALSDEADISVLGWVQ